MQKLKIYRCPHCTKTFKELGGWCSHVETFHSDMIPEGYTLSRYFYFILTGKTHGKCIQCKRNTNWNDVTGKYERFCSNPQCKKDYRKLFEKRMINTRGKVHLLNDPEQQRKMLANRKISGEYQFENGVSVSYVGSYEKNFLIMLDTFLMFNPDDLMAPSPHTYFYDYKNPDDITNEGRKFYIPDFYIPSLNLEIEIKDGTNKHPNIIHIDRVKEKLKDELMKNNKTVKYIKIVENDFSNFFELLMNLKNEIEIEIDKNIKTKKISFVEEAYNSNDYLENIDSQEFSIDLYNSIIDN